MGKARSVFHRWFPSLCFHSLPLWSDNQLRCPVCGRLLAYCYYLHGEIQVHMCYPTTDEATAYAMRTVIYTSPDELDLLEVLELLHEHEPYEPLLSDRWDDDNAYQEDVQNYIRFIREQEKLEEKDCDNL